MNFVPTEAKWFCNRCADWREGEPPTSPPTAVFAPASEAEARQSPSVMDLLGYVTYAIAGVIALVGIALVVMGYPVAGSVVIALGVISPVLLLF